MAYETKVLLSLISQQVARAKSVKEIYSIIVNAANVEGLQLPSYEEIQKSIKDMDDSTDKNN